MSPSAELRIDTSVPLDEYCIQHVIMCRDRDGRRRSLRTVATDSVKGAFHLGVLQGRKVPLPEEVRWSAADNELLRVQPINMWRCPVPECRKHMPERYVVCMYCFSPSVFAVRVKSVVHYVCPAVDDSTENEESTESGTVAQEDTFTAIDGRKRAFYRSFHSDRSPYAVAREAFTSSCKKMFKHFSGNFTQASIEDQRSKCRHPASGRQNVLRKPFDVPMELLAFDGETYDLPLKNLWYWWAAVPPVTDYDEALLDEKNDMLGVNQAVMEQTMSLVKKFEHLRFQIRKGQGGPQNSEAGDPFPEVQMLRHRRWWEPWFDDPKYWERVSWEKCSTLKNHAPGVIRNRAKSQNLS